MHALRPAPPSGHHRRPDGRHNAGLQSWSPNQNAPCQVRAMDASWPAERPTAPNQSDELITERHPSDDCVAGTALYDPADVSLARSTSTRKVLHPPELRRTVVLGGHRRQHRQRTQCGDDYERIHDRDERWG